MFAFHFYIKHLVYNEQHQNRYWNLFNRVPKNLEYLFYFFLFDSIAHVL